MPENDRQTILGRVVHVELEGGFWGIIDETGKKYVPLDPLESPFLKNGLKIEAEIETVLVFSASMWGQHVRMHKIRKMT